MGTCIRALTGLGSLGKTPILNSYSPSPVPQTPRPRPHDEAEWERRTCIELEHVMRSHLEYAMEEMSCVSKQLGC